MISLFRRDLGTPRYGIPYWRIAELQADADEHLRTLGRSRTLAGLAYQIHRRSAAAHVGHAAIKLAAIATPEELRAVLRA